MPAGSRVPTERNDGKEEETPSNETDWKAEAEVPVDESEGEVETPAPSKDKTKPEEQGDEGEQPPAPRKETPGKKPGDETPPAGETPAGKKPGEEETPPKGEETPPAETPEQKQQREAQEAEQRQKYTQDLEKYYEIPEDLAARLSTEPEKVLPVLAAKVHQAVELGMRNYVAQTLPQMFHQYQTVVEANQKSKEALFGHWPGLSKHEKQVKEMGAMFRQMNPKATPEEAIERIGLLTCAALGISPEQARKKGTTPAPKTPARPAAGARPAGVHGSQAGAAPPSENEWEKEANEMLEEDQQ